MKAKYKNYIKNVAVPVLVYGTITGVLVGSFVFLFKLMAEWACEEAVHIYAYIMDKPYLIPVALIAIAGLAYLTHLLHKWSPESKGGGISRAEGIIRGVLTFRWLRTALAVWFNSLIAFALGMPLGPEGPSVAIGTSIGSGVSKLPISHNSWNKYIMTAGASAGITVAYNAPLTGLVFALEEVHKKFTPMLLLMAFFAVTSANATSTLFSALIGHEPAVLFNVGEMSALALGDLWTVLLLGVAVGLAASLFNYLIAKWIHFFTHTLKGKISPALKIVLVFVIVSGLSFVLYNVTDGGIVGNGAMLIVPLSGGKIAVGIIALLLVVKLITITFTTTSGVTGGIFAPLLAVGALVGALSANGLVAMGMDANLFSVIVMIGMVCFLGSTCRAPLTGIVFLFECTWQFSNMLYVVSAMMIAVIIPELLRIEPVYDALLEPLVEQEYHGKESEIYNLPYEVKEGCFVEGKQARDILWPANTIIREINVIDAKSRMDNDGEIKLHVGDRLLLQIESYNLELTKTELNDLLGVQ